MTVIMLMRMVGVGAEGVTVMVAAVLLLLVVVLHMVVVVVVDGGDDSTGPKEGGIGSACGAGGCCVC